MIRFNLNNNPVEVDVEDEMPLLWVIRDVLKLTGTKYSCGIAMCGACVVHVDGDPTRACVTPVSQVRGRKVTTIEGLTDDVGDRLKRAWVEVDVPQCGYCQSGQIMTAHHLLRTHTKIDDQSIDSAMSGNLCRCGSYQRIRMAVKMASKV